MSSAELMPATASRRTSPGITPRRRVAAWLRAVLLPLISGLAGLAIWEILVETLKVPSYLVPAPSMVLHEIVDNGFLLLQQLGITAISSAIGFVATVILALGFAAVITASRTIDRMVYPWLVIWAAIPKVVMAPLFLVWFGFGIKSEVFFVVTFTFFPLVVNSVAGLRSADPELLLLARAMGASDVQTLRKIRIPTALPSIFAGIKIAITLAPVGAVIGEFVASNAGIGHLLVVAVGNMETPLAFAGVTVFAIFGVALWYVTEAVERVMLPWHASQRDRFR